MPTWTLACTLLFAGCGDVRGEDIQGVDGVPALTVNGRGSSYLAYQDGSGAWQALSTQLSEGAPQKLGLTDPQGRYGVMNLCLDGASGNLSVNVQHRTLAETSVVTASCASAPAAAGVAGVSGLVRGLEPGEYGNVYLGGASALVDSAAPRHRLELPPARYDLIATRYAPDERVPSRLVFEPGLIVSGATTADVDFGGPYAFAPEADALPLAGVRPGELLSGSVAVVTETGTAALLGEYQGGTVLPYARPPAELLRGARLRAEVQSFSYDGRTKAGSSRSLTRTFAGDTPPLLRLPHPLAAPLLLLRLRGEALLRVAARWRAYPAAAGVYTQFYSQIQDGRSVSYRLSQSSAWLAGRPFSYTLPDFSALPEWREVWGLARGAEIFWDVSFRRETQNATLFASRSGVLTP